MPWFGKKEKKEKPPEGHKPAYPTQPKPVYPTQAAAAAAAPRSVPPPMPGAPPSYSPVDPAVDPAVWTHTNQVSYATQQQQSYTPIGYSSYPGAMGYPPAGYPPPGGYSAFGGQVVGPPGQTVVVQGGFDAGARFDGSSGPSLPPPPPGCLPNAAQLATAQGHNVVITQQQGNVWTGGSDGGYTFF